MAEATLLTPAQLAAVTQLVDRATAVDGTPPLSDQTLLRLHRAQEQTPGEVHLVIEVGGTTVGYGNVLDGVGELAVHPDHRRQGHGRALVEQALAGTPNIRLWAHGNHPGATRLAEEFALHATRELWQLRRPLSPGSGEAVPLALPRSLRLRAFHPGHDETAWLELNRRAFADHPEQGHWGLSDLTDREAEPWFDPKGFLLAERATDGRLLGFHWTKVHSQVLGEVYVLGVDPEAQGLKLGKLLLQQGLAHLADRGCEEVMLYVDADNTSAVRLYERAGFTQASVDVRYEAVSSQGSAAAGPGPARPSWERQVRRRQIWFEPVMRDACGFKGVVDARDTTAAGARGMT